MAIVSKPKSKSVAAMIGAAVPTSRKSSIPKSYPQSWQDYLDALQRRASRVMAMGIPGTGKTYSANEVGLNEDEVVYNIYVGDETAAYQFMGAPSLKAGNSEFEYGPALHAFTRGTRLVINEIDHASADALDALIGVCDDWKSAKITLPDGTIVRPTEGYHVVATMNGELDDLPEALRDRFEGCAVSITEPHPDAIAALPEELQETAKKLTRESCPVEQRVSIRQFRGFAELLDLGMDMERAARCSFRERAEDLMMAMDLRRLMVTSSLAYDAEGYAVLTDEVQHEAWANEDEEAF